MGLDGIRFTLHYEGEHLSLAVPLLGRHSVHTALRAAAVGLVEGLRWEEIVIGLQSQTAQLRLVAVPGPRGSLLIDDTYNSSPASVFAAFNLLLDLTGRRVIVLGDMLELGDLEEESHRLVGRRAATVADLLVAVGERGRLIGEEAVASGLAAERVLFAADPKATAALLDDLIAPGDIVLLKASRGLRLDRVITELGVGD
jgi:UDP-N-acetylmuramoyl-tripeptide--D-alanyl-D-alanine ligase